MSDNSYDLELAKKATRVFGWKWMPGMKAIGRRGMPNAWFRLEEQTPRLLGEWQDAVPDFSDYGTMGALLGLVREVWEDPFFHTEQGPWIKGTRECSWDFVGRIENIGVCRGTCFRTEADALLGALDGALKGQVPSKDIEGGKDAELS